jgi:hypothetical protein
VGRRLGVGASHEPGHWVCRESDKYGVGGVREAFALDRHRCPRHRANGKGPGKLIGEDGSGLGRTDPVAVARDLAGDKEQTASGRRKPRGGDIREEETEGRRLAGGEAGGAWAAASSRMKRQAGSG